jgi:hypothetical protein
MEQKLAVNSPGGMQEYRATEQQPQNRVIRFVAKLISYIFHPLFVPVYIAWFIVTVHPYLFSSFTPSQKILKLVQFFVSYSFFPLVTILLARALGFLDSIYLRTQKERVIPYIACGIFYFWMSYVIRHQPENSKEVSQLTIAIFIASSAALIANIYMKVSMHAISMGILVVFIAILSGLQAGDYTIYMSIAVFIAGLVCTARLVVSDHTPNEIYVGLLTGIGSQLLAVWADGVLP